VKPLRILVVGELVASSRSHQRIAALRDMGHYVETMSTVAQEATYEDRPSLYERIRYRLRMPVDRMNINGRLVAAIENGAFDLLWVERVLELRGRTLQSIKSRNPNIGFIWYAEDDMMNPRHRSRYVEGAIPWFDVWVTTKSFNASPDELPALGARNVLFVNNAFDPAIHHAVPIGSEDRALYGSDICFVGTFEHPRAESLVALADQGYKVRVWGNGWGRMVGRHANLAIENKPVYGEAYAKTICASRINLCFLRKSNRDLQTCRSIEIPAIGGFMLHERNAEITAILAEDKEAAYFGGDDELARQCAYWLKEEERRTTVAAAGHTKITAGRFTHRDRIEQILGFLSWARISGADL